MVAPRRVVRRSRKDPDMLKTFSLSVLFFLALGTLIAAYASVPL